MSDALVDLFAPAERSLPLMLQRQAERHASSTASDGRAAR